MRPTAIASTMMIAVSAILCAGAGTTAESETTNPLKVAVLPGHALVIKVVYQASLEHTCYVQLDSVDPSKPDAVFNCNSTIDRKTKGRDAVISNRTGGVVVYRIHEKYKPKQGGGNEAFTDSPSKRIAVPGSPDVVVIEYGDDTGSAAATVTITTRQMTKAESEQSE